MKTILLLLVISFPLSASAQHCPWDCTGFLMIKTDASKDEMEMLRPALFDSKRLVVVDTLYGTGKKTFDTCFFMEFGDFASYRKEKAKIHNWYNYDTMLSFAEGYYVVHYNYCKFSGKAPGELFIAYMGPGHGHHHYLEIPADKRIHLHDYYSLIQKGEKEQTLKAVESKIISVSRAEWGFQ